MSYCRFSSDNFSSDLYCYASGCGYTTHVAGNRVLGDIPKMQSWDSANFNADEYVAAAAKQHEFLETANREAITLPHAGESFDDPTLEDFLARLLMLRELGYKFPDRVLEAVREEIAERHS